MADETGTEAELAGTDDELADAVELALEADEAATEEDTAGLLLEDAATGALQFPFAMLSTT